MREKIRRLFYGRQGMDEFSKFLFWSGLVCLLLSGLVLGIPSSFLCTLFSMLGMFQLVFCFVRAFSRRLEMREMENRFFLGLVGKLRHNWDTWRDRRRQKDYRFFKCPGCKAILRVPRGKGKIHIQCKCGYTLYRKT